MGKRTIIAFLCTAWLLGSCTAEREPQPTAKSAVYPQLTAGIAGTQSVETRAQVNPLSNTYIRFTENDRLGLFATDALRVHDPEKDDADELDPVTNLGFTLSATGRWIGADADVPLLRWDTAEDEPADIYAYFPHQEVTENEDDILDGYNIFASISGTTTGVLKDVLIAERTTVENNNPAIFLTFKHRFALLHIEMGTGMGAVTAADEITAVMNKGVSATASLQPLNGVVTLAEGDIVNFAPVKKGNDYYILIPVDVLGGTETEPLYLESIDIRTGIGTENPKTESSELAAPLYPQGNTVYNMTLHKGEGGSIAIKMGYIELWEDWNDLAGIRQSGGLYWASDLVGLVNAIKSGGYAETNTALNKYGDWDEANECWVFKLMRNIDMSDVSNGKNAMFEEFEGVFDGGGYSITGLDVDVSSSPGVPAGLFGTVLSGSVIRDLTLVSPSVVGSSNAGALAGLVESGVTILNCHVEGYSRVSGDGAVGGLIGQCETDVSRCSANDISVENGAGDGAGGLIGILTETGSITDSRVSGSVVSQGDFAGGLVGQAYGPVEGCSANCDVSGDSSVGGLIGQATVPVTDCHSAGIVTATGDNAGGLIGETSSSVKSCTSDGSVSGEDNVGGLIGLHDVPEGESAVVEGCSSRAEVSGSGNKGGLIGKAAEYVPENWIVDPAYVPEEDESGGDPPMIKVDRKGSVVEYCYVLNGLPMIGWGGMVSYGYDIGTVESEDAENHYYTIDPDISDIGELLYNLNSGAKKVWKISTVVIGGKGYSIPILTTYN